MNRVRALCVLALSIAFSAALAGPASAASVTPVVIGDNPSCADLNDDPAFTGITSDFGFKIDSAAPNGTFTLTNAAGRQLTGGAPSDPGNSVTILNSNGTTFDWTATLGIDAVIVKGGQDSNAYVYTPEAFADSALTSPPNGGGGTADVSHVEFCFDYNLDVEKTAQTKLKRTWTWDIEKTGDQTSGGPFNPGDVFDVNYDVTVSATSADSDRAVEGTITATNNTATTTVVSSVSDQLNDGTNVPTNCTPALPATLDPGEDVTCTYEATGLDGNENKNTATVATSSGAPGGSDDAAIDWNAAAVDSIDECVDVDDDKGGSLGTVCAPADLTNGEKTFQYKLDAANGGGSCGDYTNTATFKTNDTSTTGSDSHTVRIACPTPPVPNTPQAQNDPPQQQQQQPPQQQVLGERVTPGTARLAGATGCQGKAFTVRVKGKSISRVEFSIDGKKKATDTTPDSAGRYTFKINPNKFKPGAHKVTARAVFEANSNTRPKTMSLRFSRCVRAAQAPAFTG